MRLTAVVLGISLAAPELTAQGTPATVRELTRDMPTYPFGDPNPIPVVGRIYPYFRFDGFSPTAQTRAWKVVELENRYLKVSILPEVGGKIWSAIDKRSGRSFIYNNQTVKFRDIAMRGPWTSGGIEANYGIIGHTPNVATPVDYAVRTFADGSASCTIGGLDLLTRTWWRLEVRLGKDDAALETSSTWYNASPLEQPYYSWMNVGIPVKGNLQFVYAGTSRLGHEGELASWPDGSDGRDLSRYDNNNFGGYKSYHVFGAYTDFFGAYWHDQDFGMVRYSPRDEKPGKKIWIWGLSRQGMIWEQLLTDRDGQYAEVQSGRLFNQSAEGSTYSPFKHRGFTPHTTDRWSEYWYPIAGTKGLVAANRSAALNLTSVAGKLALVVSPVVPLRDTLRVWAGNRLLATRLVQRGVLEPFVDTLPYAGPIDSIRVVLEGIALEYRADPSVGTLARPTVSPAGFDWQSSFGLYTKGKEWLRQREYGYARAALDSALARDSFFVPALADRAHIALREAQYALARGLTAKALSIDTYDGASNYYYGLASKWSGKWSDARDGFDIASQSAEYRAAAWVELGKLSLATHDHGGALRYARKALTSDAGNFDALAIEVVALRGADRVGREQALAQLVAADPFSRVAWVERNLTTSLRGLRDSIASELPEQQVLETAAWYLSIGDSVVARRVLEALPDHPEALYWRAALGAPDATQLIVRANELSPVRVFPFRPELLVALERVAAMTAAWQPKYYLALALWGCGRVDDAAAILDALGEAPDFAPLFAARANLPHRESGAAARDLERAMALDPNEWRYPKVLGEHWLARGEAHRALPLLERAARTWRGNYIVGIAFAKVLAASGRYASADSLLATMQVLPYEGAADARAIYREVKLMLTVKALAERQWVVAARRVKEAREWPEHLGAGKPYSADVDERLEDWLEADALRGRGRLTEARVIWSRLATDLREGITIADPLRQLARARLADPAGVLTMPNELRPSVDQSVLDAWGAQTGQKRSDEIPASAVGVGSWEPDSLGNHRAVIRVERPAEAVHLVLPWRRRDRSPEKVDVIVMAEGATQRIRNVERISITRERGEFVFEARTAGTYYVYYMPYTGTFRSNYPRITYRTPVATADEVWSRRALSGVGALPNARFVGFEAANAFSRFTPMEFIATAAEKAMLVSRHASAAFLAFAEDRSLSIRMGDDIPQGWATRGAFREFVGVAKRGEHFTFQIGVWAHLRAIDSLGYRSTGLVTDRGVRLDRTALTAFNLEGTDWSGRAFRRAVHVDSGAVQALWFGIDVPVALAPATYRGAIELTAAGGVRQVVPVVLTVTSEVAAHHGDDNPAQLGRLFWLNSQLAADDSIVAPFTPVRVAGNTISILGRSLTVGADGFPSRVRSYFAPNNTRVTGEPRDVLAAPIALVVRDASNGVVSFAGPPARITRAAAGVAVWEATWQGGDLTMAVRGSLEFDGTAEYTVSLRSAARVQIGDVRLEVPFTPNAAPYMMGLGQRGGRRPPGFRWTWDVARKNQDAVWIGDVNAGLQTTLKDEHYVRPLNTNFYLSKPLIAPKSWANEGKGGCAVVDASERVTLGCYSGDRTMEPGDSLRFDFRLAITPFKPLDTAGQWRTRYFHAFVPVDSAAGRGANTLNIHHANRVNPWINYPFLEVDAMRAYIDSAHARGMQGKIYYTVRELTNHAPELFALKSLGDEVLATGPGGGYSWLQEHLGDGYIAAWHVPEIKDAAVVNSGVSRWHNFYIEGLNWVARNVGIDGLYLDDVAFDRLTMKRLRKVLDRANPHALIDLHSANQFNVRDGYASSANLYLEHFPYINRLWFGEYFDYDSAPDYWLVEVSGIPFGLMGEMLEKGGNPWRGMTLGMTARLPWSGDPAPLWRAWDAFGIQESTLHGWWSGADPVRTSDPSVLATTWSKPGKAMVALGSWNAEDTTLTLSIDWRLLGLDSSKAVLRAPAIRGFQEAGEWGPGSPIRIPAKKGLLLVVEPR